MTVANATPDHSPGREGAPKTHGVSGYRWVIFAILAFAYLLVYFHRMCPAVVAVEMMTDLDAGPALMGLLAAAYFYPYAAMQFPSGLFADSLGPRKTISASFVLAGGASIVFGLAENSTLAIVARVLVGLGVSLTFVAVMKALTRWFRVREFSLMAGLLNSAGGLGSLGAAAPLALLSESVGWRVSFMAVGGATLFVAAAVWLFVRNRPEDMGLPPPEPVLEPKRKSGGVSGPRPGLWQGVKEVLSTGRFWILAIWFFCTYGIFFSFGGLWGGPYLMHVRGMTAAQAGGILSMLAVSMLVGSPLVSYVSERVLHSRKLVLLGASLVQLGLCGVLAYFPHVLSDPLLYVWAFFFGLCASGVVAVGFTACKETFSMEKAGTAIGLVNISPFLAGAIMQPLMGLVLQWREGDAEVYSAQAYGTVFTLYVCLAVVGVVATLFLRDPMRPSHGEQGVSGGAQPAQGRHDDAK